MINGDRMMRPEIQSIGKTDVRTLVIIFLVAATLFGLLCGLVYAVNLDLSGDMITPGLVANEIASHGNFQYFFPASDSYLFTDIYTFHFITQVLSGYNPMALKLTAYVMFLMVAGIFAYIIYRHSGALNALIFSALFANMSPDAYLVFISPENHIGTLIATGALIVLFSVDSLKKASGPNLLIPILIAGLATLSDNIFLAFFTVPWIVYYVYTYWVKTPAADGGTKNAARSKKAVVRAISGKQKERSSLNKAVVLLLVVTVLSFIIISVLWEGSKINLPNFISTPTSLVNPGTIVNTTFPLLVQCLAMLLNYNLYHLATGNGNLLSDIAISIVFVSLAAYSMWRPKENQVYLYSIFLLSAVFMIAGFLFTDWAKGPQSARYLVFIAVAMFAVIALAYRDDHKFGKDLNTLFLAAIVVLLLSTVPASIAKISSFDQPPNSDEYTFIYYLEDNHFTTGYSDVGTANVLTYLSGHQLAIRPVAFEKERIHPAAWLSTLRWYLTQNTSYVVITDLNDTLYTEMLEFSQKGLIKNTSYYGKYAIFQYESSNPQEV